MTARFYDLIPSLPILELSFTVTLLPYCHLCLYVAQMLSFLFAIQLSLVCCRSTILTHQSCVDCGRHVRLSRTIQPPRCPACRLACLPAPLEVRPCSRCSVPIPTSSSDLCCRDCQTRRTSDISCRDCGNPFPARPRIIRCPDCRSARSTASRVPVYWSRFQITSFDPFINSFRQSNPP